MEHILAIPGCWLMFAYEARGRSLEVLARHASVVLDMLHLVVAF